MECRFDLDTRCNYRCRYCSNFADPDQYHGPFPVEQLGTVFGSMNRLCWSIYLSCAGEPLIYPHFEAAVELANQHFRGKDVSLVTNGFLLDHKKRRLILNSCVTRLFVSIDTADEDLYAELCGIGVTAFSRVEENIRRFHQERGSNPFPKLILIALAMRSTLPHFLELAEWAEAIGFDGIRIHWLVTSDAKLEKEEVVRREQAYPVLARMNNFLAPRGVHFDYPFGSTKEKLASVISGSRLVKNKTHYLRGFFRKWRNSLTANGCRVLGTVLDVDIDGDVYCCAGRTERAGNLISDSSSQIQTNLRAFKKQRKKGEIGTCSECGFQKMFD